MIDDIRLFVNEAGFEILQVKRGDRWVPVPVVESSDIDEAKDALENIENEIIARACRNGVCED